MSMVTEKKMEAEMSFSQFGYPYSCNSQQFLFPASPSTVCYNSAARSLPDVSAHTPSICYSSYENKLLVSSRSDFSLYNTTYATASTAYASYIPYSTDPGTLYPTLTSQYDRKDINSSMHARLAHPAAYYPYDSLGQYQYNRYGAVDFTGCTRRKNATKETTSTLKSWLYEHRKNPYPTKGEKIMLAIITKMTLTQVSTWFANARRRLKKENKMTWSPKNKVGDEGQDEKQEEYKLECENSDDKIYMNGKKRGLDQIDDFEGVSQAINSDSEMSPSCRVSSNSSGYADSECSLMSSYSSHILQCNEENAEDFLGIIVDKNSFGGISDSLVPCETTENPRIWSLACAVSPNITVDPGNFDKQSLSSDCVFVKKLLCGPSQCNEIRVLDNKKYQSPTASDFKSLSNPQKICKTSDFNLQPYRLKCSLGGTFQYSIATEGFGKILKTEQESLALKQVNQENDLLKTAFKSVVKR